jgi:type I restriction enzyme R subunit
MVEKDPEPDVPAFLHGKREAIVLFNNLDSIPATNFQCPASDEDKAVLAEKINLMVRDQAPAGWKGDYARETQVLNALFPMLDRDREATLRSSRSSRISGDIDD